jgi:CBS domain-containing protein
MSAATKIPAFPRLSLEANTAEEIMSDNPISVRKGATVHEAIALMTDRGYYAAPVIDEKGRPIGVVTITDILCHDREYARYLNTGDFISRQELHAQFATPKECSGEIAGPTVVEDIMTPTVFTVDADTTAREVVRKMLHLKVHHFFVADTDGVLIGVISACDILRHLA